jgi:hypothetical protein
MKFPFQMKVVLYFMSLVKDWLTRVEKFCDSCIETLPEVETDGREHLIILGDLLEDLLMEQDDLTRKETIKEYETHLKTINNEIGKRNVRIPHKTTGLLITVPGRVTPGEQQLLAKLTWEIESWRKQSAELQKEIKTKKEVMDKKKKQLEELRSERNCLEESGEYAIDLTLSKYGVN